MEGFLHEVTLYTFQGLSRHSNDRGFEEKCGRKIPLNDNHTRGVGRKCKYFLEFHKVTPWVLHAMCAAFPRSMYRNRICVVTNRSPVVWFYGRSIYPKVVADLLWELSLFVSWDQRERQATINLCLDKEKPQLIVIHLLGLGYMHQSLRKWEKIQLQTLSRAADAYL